MKGKLIMKIELTYKEPETNLKEYTHTEIYEESEIDEALEERAAVIAHGYEIVHWRLLPN